MARRWTPKEEKKYRDQLVKLYVDKNKTIGEIAVIVNIAESTVYDRMLRLGIKSRPHRKERYRAKRRDVCIPQQRSNKLAEFFGVMLGDGGINPTQTVVHLGNKEKAYAEYIVALMTDIFGAVPKIGIRKTGYRDVYLGSVDIVRWLLKEGLVFNKVEAQVGVPTWIFTKGSYQKAFLRGVFDTDGSVYKLKFGIQISFKNFSRPLLAALQRMLCALGYSPSRISAHAIYITRIPDIKRFFREIQPKNPKHTQRFERFMCDLRR